MLDCHVVIDFSVLLYDSEFTMVAFCDWQNLTIKGCEHSGDWYGQRQERGATEARETVAININELAIKSMNPQ